MLTKSRTLLTLTRDVADVKAPGAIVLTCGCRKTLCRHVSGVIEHVKAAITRYVNDGGEDMQLGGELHSFAKLQHRTFHSCKKNSEPFFYDNFMASNSHSTSWPAAVI